MARTLANEANCLAATESPFLPRLLSAGSLEQVLCDPDGRQFEAGTPYLLLSRLPGESLGVNASHTVQAPAAEVAETVLRDLSGALRDLHAASFAHGDIKPANTLIASGSQRAFAVDLGLACPIDSHHVQGATPAYLPPEASLDGSSAQSRDLWALGRTILTILDPSVYTLPSSQLLDAGRPALSQLAVSIRRLVSALLSKNPAHRPRAEWIHSQLCSEVDVEDRQRQVRRAYVDVRKLELAPLLRGATYALRNSGQPAQWLEDICSRLVQIRKMNGVPANDAVVEIGELSVLDKRRWLLRLTGAQSSKGASLIRLSEPDLAKILWQSCEHGPPTLAALTDEGHLPLKKRPSQDEQILELGSGCLQESTLRALESRHLDTPWPLDIALELSRVLLRRNELARAQVILATLAGDRAALENAYLLMRTGSRAEAEKSLLPCTESADSHVASEARALLARLALDGGNKSQAQQWLDGAGLTPRALESRVALCLTSAELTEAERLLALALTLPLVSAQRARFEALHANLASQRSETELALSHYRSAAEQAERAGAILDEASYMTGVAQAASGLGHVRTAIGAAGRALLLFEHIDRRDSAARAELVLASTLGLSGATDEARTHARHCFRQATRSGDTRCAYYAQLVLVDTAADKDVEDYLQRAAHQLEQVESPTGGDQLHLAARQWRSGAIQSSADLDRMASQDRHEIGARLTWWTARATRHVIQNRGANDSASHTTPQGPTVSVSDDQAFVLARLTTCTADASALEARAPALARGAQLAALRGDGVLARLFTEQARQCLATLTYHTPQNLKPALQGLKWAKDLLMSEPSQLTTAQIADVVSLIRNLGDRERLGPLLERVLDAMILWTGVERGLLLLRAPENRLVPRAARNIARHNLAGAQLELSTTLAKRAMETRECVVAVDAAVELPDLHQSVHALKLRSVLAVPLIAHGEVIGVVYLDDRVRRGAFGPQELAWVQLAATVTSVAIADTRAQLVLRRSLRQTQRAEARAARALAARDAELAVAQQQLKVSVPDNAFPEIIGASGALQPLFQSIHRVAAAEVPVLILGESGTGKELVAQAIHRNSPRRDGKFVTENCSAIPETLMESTLFGHVRGAFTGASHDRIGLFELANRGTLFLDEIADMPPALQVKMLRVLEDGIVRPVGSERVKKVDVRVLAATHKDLAQLANEGHFRSDLLYRLNVFELRLPPLRDRREDIPALAQHFVEKHASEGTSPTLTQEAMAHLLNAKWPGNVRQLENEIRRALVLCDGSIRLEHVCRTEAARQPALPADNPLEDSLHLRTHVGNLERQLIERALAATGGNQTRAARLLGLSRYGLQKKMHRLFPATPD